MAEPVCPRLSVRALAAQLEGGGTQLSGAQPPARRSTVRALATKLEVGGHAPRPCLPGLSGPRPAPLQDLSSSIGNGSDGRSPSASSPYTNALLSRPKGRGRKWSRPSNGTSRRAEADASSSEGRSPESTAPALANASLAQLTSGGLVAEATSSEVAPVAHQDAEDDDDASSFVSAEEPHEEEEPCAEELLAEQTAELKPSPSRAAEPGLAHSGALLPGPACEPADSLYIDVARATLHAEAHSLVRCIVSAAVDQVARSTASEQARWLSPSVAQTHMRRQQLFRELSKAVLTRRSRLSSAASPPSTASVVAPPSTANSAVPLLRSLSSSSSAK